MNKYDERYDIRLAKEKDIPMIMKTIDLYWKKDHILSRDRKLFEYEYKIDEGVNFILAIDRKTGILEGFFGFIPCSMYDNYDKKDIWGSMWMVRKGGNNISLLGIELAKRAKVYTNCRYHIGNGANKDTTIPLRKIFFKEKTDKMKQYYRYNHFMKKYNLFYLQHEENMDYKIEKNVEIFKINSMLEFEKYFNIEKYETIPFKDNWYVNHRFFSHPYYKYQLWGIKEEKAEVEAIFVTRDVQYNNSKAIRIVDYYGKQELFGKTGCFWNDILKNDMYEYVDFYEYGFCKEALEDAGFILREDNDMNIVPNYYEPFLRENVESWIHFTDSNTLFFKADGDQDRPNQ